MVTSNNNQGAAMIETIFLRENLRARARARVEPSHAGYWHAYHCGLRRGRYGDRFCGEPEHRRWLALVGSRDPADAARGAGYRDGLAASGAVARSNATDGRQ